jgi:ABC-type sugar transport system ATPase subunit
MELRRLQNNLKITTLYVTHNQREASEIGDEIAVIHRGRLEQKGTHSDLFFKPKNRYVSNLLGSPNLFHCKKFIPLISGLAKVELNGISLVVPYDGRPVEMIAISPGSIYISREAPPGPQINRLKGKILVIEHRLPVVKTVVGCGDERMVVEVEADLWNETGLRKGDTASLILPLRWIKVKSKNEFLSD